MKRRTLATTMCNKLKMDRSKVYKRVRFDQELALEKIKSMPVARNEAEYAAYYCIWDKLIEIWFRGEILRISFQTDLF